MVTSSRAAALESSDQFKLGTGESFPLNSLFHMQVTLLPIASLELETRRSKARASNSEIAFMGAGPSTHPTAETLHAYDLGIA